MVVREHDPFRARMKTLAILLGVLTALLFIGGLGELGIEGPSSDVWMALAGAFVGLTFVVVTFIFLGTPTIGLRTALIVLLLLFALCWLVAFVLALTLSGELDSQTYVAIVVVVSAVTIAALLMSLIVVDGRKVLSAPGGGGRRTSRSFASDDLGEGDDLGRR